MTTAVPPSQVATTVGILTKFQNLAPGGFALQQRIALIGQGATATTYTTVKRQVFSAFEVGDIYGFGSPLHESALQLFPPSGKGVGSIPVWVFPLVDGTTASAGTITPSGTTTAAGTYTVNVNNIAANSFSLASGASVADATLAMTAAINAVSRMPVVASDGTTVVDLDAKWKGLSGDDIGNITIDFTAAGMTFVIVDPTAGATDPVIDSTVTDQFGDTWFTFVLNCLGGTTLALDALATFNELRWDPSIVKFFVAAYASVETSVATAVTVTDARKSDRTNCQLMATGSLDLPWAIAAAELREVVLVANSASPATSYIRKPVAGVTPGLDNLQWTAAERQTAVTSGCSTSEIRDGVLTLSDTVTMYHPTGDPTPAYRNVVTIVKLMQLNNDVKSTFDSPLWIGNPLIPNGQATTNPDAKRPSMAVSALAKLIDSWALKALISDPDTAKESIAAGIDGGNPDRLNLSCTVQVSGNVGIISMDLNWGFFFGA